MKIYKDKNLTKELEGNIFDLGIVPAGESKEYNFWVLNESPSHLIDLKFIVEHDEVKILKYPKELHSNSVGELVIKWSPSVTLKQGLETKVRVTGKELWG